MAIEPRGYERQRGDARLTPTPMADANAFGADVGRAIAQVGDTVHRNQINAYKVERQQKADQEVADFNARFAAARERMDRASIDARNNAAPGATGHADAMAQAWDKERAQLLTGMTETRLIQHAEQQLGEFGSRLRSSEYQYEQSARIGKTVADFQNMSDLSANRARQAHDPASYAEELKFGRAGIEAMAGVPADVKDKLVREHEQRVSIGYLNGLNDTNPALAVAMLEAGTFNEILSPEQIEQARNGAQVEVRRMDAEKRQAYNVERTKAQTQVEETLQMGRDGQPLSQSQLSEIGGLIQQYGLDGKAYDFVKISAENDVRRVTQRLGPQEIANQRNSLASKVAKAGEAASASDVAALAEYDRQLARRRSEVRGDPFGYAARVGIAVAPLDMDNPRSVRARIATVQNIERSTGERVGLYQPDEARQVAGLAAAGVAGREQAAQELARWGGVNALRAAQQVVPKDFGLQHAILISPEVQRQIFQGEELRKGNPKLAPHSVISDGFNDAVGGALGQTPAWYRNGVLYNAGNIYAYMAAKKGVSSDDGLDADLFDDALNLAIDDTGKGGIGIYGSKKNKVILPHGITQSEFDRRVARIGKINGFYYSNKQPIEAATLKQKYHPVASDRPGLYYWADAQGQFAVRSDGRSLALMNLGDE
jgi:hypothetical protein